MDSQIKQLEILAQGTYVQKMFARILLGFGILAGIFIVSCSAVLINATNKYHDYMINTEEVVYTESVEEFYDMLKAPKVYGVGQVCQGSLVPSNLCPTTPTTPAA